MSKHYNLSQIRALLNEGFTDEEIRQLCYDTPNFRPVYDQSAQNSGKNEIVHRLVEYADRKDLLERLLMWAQEHNLTKYERYSPYYVATHEKIETQSQGNHSPDPKTAPEIRSFRRKYVFALVSLISILLVVFVIFLYSKYQNTVVCVPSGSRSIKAETQFSNQSSKSVEISWVDENGRENVPLILYPGEIKGTSGYINDSVCVRELNSRTIVANTLLAFDQQTIIISGTSDLKVETSPSIQSKSQLFIDNFRDQRPKDPIPLRLTDSISLTTKIEDGKFVAIGKSGSFSQRMYTTNSSFEDFELIVDIDSLEGSGGSFIVHFREAVDKWKSSAGYKFEIVVNQTSVNFFRIYTQAYIDGGDGGGYISKEIYSENLNPKIAPFRQLKVICKKDNCEFSINSQKIYSDGGFRIVSGNINIDVSNDYTIRLSQILVKTPE